jgi:hypothetical protein
MGGPGLSDYYYRVDALRDDHKAGSTLFVRAANFEGARAAVLELDPSFSEGWTLTPTKIKREDYPVPVELPELVLDDLNPELVLETLLDLRRSGVERPALLTRYPWDVVDGDVDTRDTVALGYHDEAVVVNAGDPTTEEGEPA